MNAPPAPINGDNILEWAKRFTVWARRIVPLKGTRTRLEETERGIIINLEGPQSTEPTPFEFERSQVDTTTLKFRAGHYYSVGSSRTLCPETTFSNLETNGDYAIYAKFTYSGSWATNVVDGVTTILHKSAIGSVPADNQTQRVIILQRFTVAGNVISSIEPQEWLGAVWCYDIGACTT